MVFIGCVDIEVLPSKKKRFVIKRKTDFYSGGAFLLFRNGMLTSESFNCIRIKEENAREPKEKNVLLSNSCMDALSKTDNDGFVKGNDILTQRKENSMLGFLALKASQRVRSGIRLISENPLARNFRNKRLTSQDDLSSVDVESPTASQEPYLFDLFHTLIDMRWRWISIIFSLCFVGSWLFFGILWWIVAAVRQKPDYCVTSVDSWTTAFLFSIETQATIGYGGRQVTPNCPEGVILIVVQTTVGNAINCVILGLVFTKIARPKNRGKAVVFSRKAVVAMRDSCLCLMFRFVDIRRNKLYDCNLRAVLICSRVTKEGELIPFDTSDLELTLNNRRSEFTLRLFPTYPVTVCHAITARSPFYRMTKDDLEQADFEIVLILEGSVPTTGMVTQAMTSYRASDILWGHRFKPMCGGNSDAHAIDLNMLEDTYSEAVILPFSAEEFDIASRHATLLPEEEKHLEEETQDSSGYESGPHVYV